MQKKLVEKEKKKKQAIEVNSGRGKIQVTIDAKISQAYQKQQLGALDHPTSSRGSLKQWTIFRICFTLLSAEFPSLSLRGPVRGRGAR